DKGGRIGFDHVLDQRVQADGGDLCAAAAGLDLADAQQRREQGQDAVAFAIGRSDERRAFLLRQPGFGGFPQRRLQPGERRAQVMGDVAGDLAQIVHQRLDPVEHAIEGAGLLGKGAAERIDRHAPGVIARDDGIGR
ncbi:hypothetical protein QT22_00385, partial [Staphylococcus aureus]